MILVFGAKQQQIYVEESARVVLVSEITIGNSCWTHTEKLGQRERKREDDFFTTKVIFEVKNLQLTSSSSILNHNNTEKKPNQ